MQQERYQQCNKNDINSATGSTMQAVNINFVTDKVSTVRQVRIKIATDINSAKRKISNISILDK